MHVIYKLGLYKKKLDMAAKPKSLYFAEEVTKICLH